MNESDFTRGREMVESQLGPLGVRLTREVGPDAQSFGNAYADFNGPFLCLRLLLDRGDLYLQITPVQEVDRSGESSHWYPVEGVVEFLGGDPTGEPPTLSTLAVEIQQTREHWPALSQLFAQWPAAKAPLDEFLRRRFDEPTRPKP
jgi:hypothetical protein